MHKSKLAFGVETSTRKVQWCYIITCLVASIKATHSTAMNKITATKALTDYPFHIQQYRQVGRAYPLRAILQPIAESNQEHFHVTYTSTYQKQWGHDTKTNGKLQHVDCYLVWRVRWTEYHARTHARAQKLGRLLITSMILTPPKPVLSGISNANPNLDLLSQKNTGV
jgi:hypothetical protein